VTLKLSNKKDQGIYNKSELIQLPNSKLKQILSIKDIFIKENKDNKNVKPIKLVLTIVVPK